MRDDRQSRFNHTVPTGSRRLAWNGISFCVPSNWELAVYRLLRRGVSRIELEDEYSVRVETEWVRGRQQRNRGRILKRYETASKPLTVKSDEQNDIDGLPQGWNATHFVLKETAAGDDGEDLRVVRHELVTAFYLSADSSLFCFVLLHFLPDDNEDPVHITRQLTGTFQDHQPDGIIPWELFDIGFALPREFALEKAEFGIGAKKMVFRRRTRRLYLWHFSCADILLKDGTKPAEWASGYLNGFGGIKGVRFAPDGKGGIAWRRRMPFLFGHREEIARLCFRYKIDCWVLPEANQLVVRILHYRHASDLQMLPALENEPRQSTPARS